MKNHFISTTIDIYTKLLTFSETSVKVKVSLAWTFFEILLTSVVTCKQGLLHRSKVMQHFQNYKCYDVDYFRKHFLQSNFDKVPIKEQP